MRIGVHPIAGLKDTAGRPAKAFSWTCKCGKTDTWHFRWAARRTYNEHKAICPAHAKETTT